MSFIRLNKLVAQIGLCSRREADEYISRGWIRVNNAVVTKLGTQVDPSSQIELAKEAKRLEKRKKTILFHKPLGIVSSQPESDSHIPAVQLLEAENYLDVNERKKSDSRRNLEGRRLKGLRTAGRLDVNSTGLLVFTQRGNLSRQLTGNDNEVEKEYLVRVDKPLDTDLAEQDYVNRLLEGILDDGERLECKDVSILNEHQLQFILTRGRHHHIRRMCRGVDLEVQALKRVRIGKIPLGKLPVGKWRYLRDDESFV